MVHVSTDLQLHRVDLVNWSAYQPGKGIKETSKTSKTTTTTVDPHARNAAAAAMIPRTIPAKEHTKRLHGRSCGGRQAALLHGRHQTLLP